MVLLSSTKRSNKKRFPWNLFLIFVTSRGKVGKITFHSKT
ncbi:hypothetical protein X975_24262, partial [Stegodyphus mimosarum]